MLAEVRAHDELELWPKSDDPALLHPMSPRLVQILETYKRLYKETGKEQPFLKNARYAYPQHDVRSIPADKRGFQLHLPTRSHGRR